MNFEELSIEDKKDILNLETRKLLSIIDKINDEEYEYYNYEQYDLNENDYLIKEYELIKLAVEKLIRVIKD
mgnify:CR=1 FL=1